MQLTVNILKEEDGSISLSLNELDLAVNADNLEQARKLLVADIIEYAQEYYDNFQLYSQSPNRKHHLNYILKAPNGEDVDVGRINIKINKDQSKNTCS